MAQRGFQAPALAATLRWQTAGPTPLLTTLRGMPHSPLPNECRPGVRVPYQAVRIPFDEMRRHRVTNLPRGCRWGASENQNVPQGARKQETRGHRVSTRPEFHSGRSGQAAPEWRVPRTANQLKNNQPQSPRRREIAELFSQSPEHKHSHMREV